MFYKKLMAFAMLLSVAGTNIALAQPAPVDNYTVLPPLGEFEQKTVPASYNAEPNYTYNQGFPLQGKVSVVPLGTSFQVVTATTVSSAASQVGEMFTATIAEPVNVGGQEVIPAGSQVIGQVTYVEPAGRVGKNAKMDVRFTSIKLPNGAKVPITAKVVTVDKTGTLKGGSLKNQIVKAAATGAVATGAGTLTGLSLGAITGGIGGGAVVGTAAGGLFGLGYVFSRKGKEVTIPAGQKMSIVLEQPVTVGR